MRSRPGSDGVRAGGPVGTAAPYHPLSGGRRALARLLAALLLALAAAGRGASQEAPPAASVPGEQLQVYLATYGQGGAVWELFGHNALWVWDASTGQTLSYNWGSFSFDEPGFLPRLIRGSMRYWLAVANAEEEVAAYRYWNRSVTVQELNLAPAQKASLKQFVEWNALPENRYYDYHYYRDNCSTRVRDALDLALGGELARQLQAVRGTATFRSHSLRLTARAPLTYTGIELGLADSVDHPLSAWEEAFAPMELMRRLRSVRLPTGNASTRPLVLAETTVFQSSRPAELAAAPSRVSWYLALGLAIGLCFAVLGRVPRPERRHYAGILAARSVARWTLALAALAWSLLAGLFGTLVLLLWTSTGHTFTYGNENLLQVNPLSLLLAGLAPAALLGSRRAARLACPAAALVAGLSVLGLLLKLLPAFDQMNHDIIALVLPAHLALWFALFRAKWREPSTAGDR